MAGGFRDLLVELFDPVGGVSFRKMSGGLGIFRQGLMFALVADDTLYLKADATTSVAFKAEGCGPFVYDGKDRPIVMQYWRLPERPLRRSRRVPAMGAQRLCRCPNGHEGTGQSASCGPRSER